MTRTPRSDRSSASRAKSGRKREEARQSEAERRRYSRRAWGLTVLAVLLLAVWVGVAQQMRSRHDVVPAIIQAQRLHEVRYLRLRETNPDGTIRLNRAGTLYWQVIANELNINNDKSTFRHGELRSAPEFDQLAPIELWLPLRDSSCEEVARSLAADCEGDTLLLPEGVRLSSDSSLFLRLKRPGYPMLELDLIRSRYRQSDLAHMLQVGHVPGILCVHFQKGSDSVLIEANGRSLSRSIGEGRGCGGLRMVAGNGSLQYPASLSFINVEHMLINGTASDVWLDNLVGQYTVGTRRSRYSGPGPHAFLRAESPNGVALTVRTPFLTSQPEVKAKADAAVMARVAGEDLRPTSWERHKIWMSRLGWALVIGFVGGLLSTLVAQFLGSPRRNSGRAPS
jgi:hypothetical protein